jgi:hypothetical protein
MEVTMKVLKTLSRLYVNDLNLALEFYEDYIEPSLSSTLFFEDFLNNYFTGLLYSVVSFPIWMFSPQLIVLLSK